MFTTLERYSQPRINLAPAKIFNAVHESNIIPLLWDNFPSLPFRYVYGVRYQLVVDVHQGGVSASLLAIEDLSGGEEYQVGKIVGRE